MKEEKIKHDKPIASPSVFIIENTGFLRNLRRVIFMVSNIIVVKIKCLLMLFNSMYIE